MILGVSVDGQLQLRDFSRTLFQLLRPPASQDLLQIQNRLNKLTKNLGFEPEKICKGDSPQISPRDNSPSAPSRPVPGGSPSSPTIAPNYSPRPELESGSISKFNEKRVRTADIEDVDVELEPEADED